MRQPIRWLVLAPIAMAFAGSVSHGQQQAPLLDEDVKAPMLATIYVGAASVQGDAIRYCTNHGPLALTLSGANVSGQYRIRTAADPIDGTLQGTMRDGLIDGTWRDRDGSGRIIIGLTADNERLQILYNNQRRPSHWFPDSWFGERRERVLKPASPDQERKLLCD